MTKEEWLAGKCPACGRTRGECIADEVCKPKCKGGWDLLVREVAEWQNATFEGDTVDAKMDHLMEEARHLAEVHAEVRRGDVDSELADCFILLIGIADKLGIDILTATWKKLDINKRRKWAPPDARGICRHL